MHSSIRSTKRRKQNYFPIIIAIITLIWMSVIFFQSSEPYHKQDIRPFLSKQIPTDKLQKLLPHIEFTYDREFVTWTKPYEMLEFFIRKGAHVLEYTLLTLLLIFLIRNKIKNRFAIALISSLIAIFYASTDEWHQSFVPERTGHPIDVAVDAIGVLFAILLYWIFSHRRRDI